MSAETERKAEADLRRFQFVASEPPRSSPRLSFLPSPASSLAFNAHYFKPAFQFMQITFARNSDDDET